MTNRIELTNWLDRPQTKARKFWAEVEAVDKTDVYVSIFDQVDDLFPVLSLQLENSEGKLMLRVWKGSDLSGDPTINEDVTVDRSQLDFDPATGEDK